MWFKARTEHTISIGEREIELGPQARKLIGPRSEDGEYNPVNIDEMTHWYEEAHNWVDAVLEARALAEITSTDIPAQWTPQSDNARDLLEKNIKALAKHLETGEKILREFEPKIAILIHIASTASPDAKNEILKFANILQGTARNVRSIHTTMTEFAHDLQKRLS